MRKSILSFAFTTAALAFAADLRVPQQIVAGKGANIEVSGSGTLYVSGPGFAAKHDVKDGSFELKPEDTRAAGNYIAELKSGDGTGTREFTILPDQNQRNVVQARLSRTPVHAATGIIGPD